MNRRFLVALPFLLFCAGASATPVTDFQLGTNFAMKQLPSPYAVTGTVSAGGMTPEGSDYEVVTKPSGSLTGTANMIDLAASLNINAIATMAGTATGTDTIRFVLTAPGAIGQNTTIDFNGTMLTMRITQIIGELNTKLVPQDVKPDQVSGVGRNLEMKPLPASSNFIQVKGLLSGFLPVTIRVEPADYTGSAGVGTMVQGVATLQGIADPTGLTITIEAKSGSTVVATGTGQLSNQFGPGWYSIGLPITSGSYDLYYRVSGPGFLTNVEPSGTMGSIVTVDLTMVGGDANGDDSVDLLDYFALSDSYNLSTGDAGFDAGADFNRDGSVDLLDYFILSDSYNVSGPT
jgi:hypothetical protein